MKKEFVITSLLFLLLLVPFNVKAFNVSGVSFTGPSEVKVGESFDLNFKLNFSDISYRGPMGISSAGFYFEYDKSVLAPVSVDSNIPYSIMTTTSDGKSLVASVISDMDDKNYKCADEVLFCDNEYTVTINFVVKADSPTQTSVKISEIGLDVIQVVVGKEYDEEDISEVTVEAGQTVALNIVKPVITTPKKDTDLPKKDTSTPSNISKSNNKFLKKIEVENYTINFDKYKYNYDIVVEDDVNSLNVKAELQNSKAKYTITGNDDLKKNDNKVVIEVTAENGDKNIYTIYVKKKSDKVTENEDKKEFKKATINVDKKYIKIGSIVIAVIILIIIISFVIRKINDKKIDKLVDKM